MPAAASFIAFFSAACFWRKATSSCGPGEITVPGAAAGGGGSVSQPRTHTEATPCNPTGTHGARAGASGGGGRVRWGPGFSGRPAVAAASKMRGGSCRTDARGVGMRTGSMDLPFALAFLAVFAVDLPPARPGISVVLVFGGGCYGKQLLLMMCWSQQPARRHRPNAAAAATAAAGRRLDPLRSAAAAMPRPATVVGRVLYLLRIDSESLLKSIVYIIT
jgi:hypothetical protein